MVNPSPLPALGNRQGGQACVAVWVWAGETRVGLGGWAWRVCGSVCVSVCAWQGRGGVDGGSREPGPSPSFFRSPAKFLN